MSDFMQAAMNGSLGGQDFSIAELREIGKALEDAALGVARSGVNYPLQGVQYDSTTLSPNGELSPLVPQSIENTLVSTTFSEKHLKFWPSLASIDVTQPLHEYSLVHQYGGFAMEPFFAEGGVGAVGEPIFERQTIRMKYMMEMVSLTDVGVMTGLMGPDASAVAMRTKQATISLTHKLENLLFWADSRLNPNAFDGLYAQLERKAPNNVTNMYGASAGPTKLQEILGTLVSPDLYALPNKIYCSQQQFQAWVNEALTYGRFDQASAGARSLYYGQDQLFVSAPGTGRIEIQPLPFLSQRRNPIKNAMGGAGAPAILTPTIARVASVTGSEWQSGDVDSKYLWYILELYGDRGTSVTTAAGGVQVVASGDGIRIRLPDSGYALAGDGSLKYVKLYRAATTDAVAPTDLRQYEWVGSHPRNTLNAGATEIYDLNTFRPGTSPIFLGQFDPETINWYKFLPFTRRTIPTLDTTIKFALMLFGALNVRVPSKMWLLRNVKNS